MQAPPARFRAPLGLFLLAMTSIAAPLYAAQKPPAQRKTAPPPRLPRPIVSPTPPNPARTRTLVPREYLPVASLRPGMVGYGLTVFRGNKIERFDVTILGVLKKVYNGRDLVLVKLGGPNMRRLTGIAHGMSGSPVYVNGRLVGAVSMGSQFTREPIGYVTPIESMLDAWDPAIPQYKDLSAQTRTVPLSASVQVSGQRFDRIAFLPPNGKASGFAPGTLLARPTATRVQVAGVSGPRFRRVADMLAKWGLDAKEGPGAGMANGGIKGAPLIPGGCIGMSLATGDIDLTATGTVTYRRGGRLLAFGHPFLGIGPVAAPMFTAYVHDLEPSFADSSIIASPVTEVGAFSQDRPFSVAGTIGATPAMLPITVHVADKMMGRNRVFRARLLQHPDLTPRLATVAADTAIAEVHGQPGDAMATVRTTVVADEVGTLTRVNRVYDAQEIDATAIEDLESLMRVLSANPFYPVAIRSVKMDVTITRGRQTAQVERIFLKQTQYEPGDTVEVGVVLKPFKQERVIRTLQVRIPPATPNGTLTLSVQGGNSGGGGGIRIGGITLFPSGGGSDNANAATVKQLARKWQEKERNDELVARLALPSSAVSIQGEKLSDLPPHIEAAMRGGVSGGGSSSYSGGATPRSSSVRVERDEVKTTIPTGYVLSGGQSLSIRVARRGPSERPLGSADTSSPSGTPSGSGTAAPIPISVPATPAFRPGSDADDDLARLPRTTGLETLAAPPATPASIPIVARPEMPTVVTPERGPTSGSVSAPPPSSDSPAPVGRAPGIWRQASAEDFRAGTLEGVTVTSLGDVRPAPRLQKFADSNEPYFWSLAPGENGTVYAGSGDNGIVYRAESDGKLTAWARTNELEVHSLIRTSDGTVYAGTAPNGRVFRIGSDGKPTLLCAFKEKYVFALALSPDGNTLYAATGGGGAGKVYAVPLTGSGANPTVLYEGGESSVTALTGGKDGAVYAGTAPNGLVLRLSASGGKATVLYDAAEADVTGLSAAANGTVYAATTAPRSVLYRLAPGAAPQIVALDRAASSGTLTNLQIGADGTLYAASGATVYAVGPGGDDVRTFDAPSDIQILSLLLSPDGNLWASTGNTAGVYRLSSSASTPVSGTFTSPVFDARATAKWGALRWTATRPAGTSVVLQTRSGDTANPKDPNAAWSEWSRPYAVSGGEAVASPPGRYLQYRATLTGGGGNATGDAAAPILRAIEVFYKTPNQAPQVTLASPRGGEVWRGNKTVRWTGTDPDRDTLQYEVSVSSDGGKTWLPLRTAGGAKTFTSPASAPTPPRTTRPAAPPVTMPPVAVPPTEKVLAELRSELEKHPEISPAMRERILADAPGQITAAQASSTPSATDAAASAPATRETSLPWDTTALPDGVYLLRVVASDRPANPEGTLTGAKVSGEFRIVNRAPTLVLFRKGITVDKDRTARVEGIALHRPGVAVRGVQYRVDNGDWLSAVATDGLFDSDSEAFTVTTTPLPVGEHTLEVQAQDEAGNLTTQKQTVTVR